MAITPRSFTQNPALLFLLSIASLGMAALLFAAGPSSESLSVRAAVLECRPSTSDSETWSPLHWEYHVHCLMESGHGDAAYSAADRAVTFYPRSPMLLNLRGFVAGRNGDHAVANYDFRLGKQVTGSPSGVFENNIAWTTLWQLEGLSPERTERVLMESRALYERSLSKGVSCERVHTGMFVEFAIADLNARTSPDARGADEVQEAVERYSNLFERYRPCWNRLSNGDDLLVEEIFTAAVIDQQMGYLAGVRRPNRHFGWLDASLRRAEDLGIDVDAEYCATTLPIAGTVPACEALLR